MRQVLKCIFAFALIISPAMLSARGAGVSDDKATNDADKKPPADSSKKDSKSDSTANAPSVAELAAEVAELRAMVKEQADQIARLQADHTEKNETANSMSATSAGAPAAPSAGALAAASDSALTASGAPSSAEPAPTNRVAPPQPPATPALASQAENNDSPLSFRIGGAEFTPGGFLDLTNIFRTTNEGTLGTNFFNLPFKGSVANGLTEDRFTASNSRISLKVTEDFGKNKVMGYIESDFLGNDAANVAVSSNSHTFRMRQYWVDVKRGKFELLAGQAWSWLTPNRAGLSSLPENIFITNDIDFNYQVGLTWTRAPQVRFIYHPSDHWGFGLALENPDQFGGQGEITFPVSFNAQLATQIDSAAGGTSTPNLMPDLIPKVAYDTDFSGRHFHFEVAGLISGFKITDKTAAGNFTTHRAVGGGVSSAFNIDIAPKLRFVTNGFWSNGGGRYVFGMGPDLVVLPNAAGTDVFLSTVNSYSGIIGFESQVTLNTLFSAYWGGAYFGRNFAPDTTPLAKPNTLTGFGWPGSSPNNNKSLQEPSFDWTQTFWKSRNHGTLQLITQWSYVTRSPWFVAPNTPKNAHLFMPWLDLRFTLP